MAHPEETMQRASHALVGGGEKDVSGERDVWAVDPVDAQGLDDLLAEYGTVRGVVVLVDRHSRDAADIANRHGVPVYLPEFVDVSVDAPVEQVSGTLPDSAFEVTKTVDWPGWTEAALYDGETLVVGDAFGSADYFTARGERVGLHPLLRIKPPAAFRQFEPARVFTGHGEGVTENGASALRDALNGARARAPAVWLNGLKAVLPD